MYETQQAERSEADKLRQLLTYEETRRCDLEGLLDQAHKQARDQKHQMQAQVIHKLDTAHSSSSLQQRDNP